MRDYRERLAVPIGWWILAVPVILSLSSYGFYVGADGRALLIGLAVFTAGYVIALLAWGATRIEVSAGRLRAGSAVLPLGMVTEAVPLDAAQAAALRGPRANPAAHMLIRPFLKQAVYIAVRDPAGQVPYWLVGTRRPAELAAAIERGRLPDAPVPSRESAG